MSRGLPPAPGRMAAVQPPVVPMVGRLVAETPGALSLAQGMVFYPPPPAALEAARDYLAANDGAAYAPVEGLPELRTAITAKLRSDNGIDCERDGQHVMVTAGANMAFVNAVLAISAPGDEVILLRPYYFNHEMSIRMLGCVPVVVDCDDDYLPDPAGIAAAITARTRAVVTVSPNNPSGAILPATTLAAIDGLCAAAGLWHIRDEAYEYFRFDAQPPVPPGGAGHTIYLYSLSKSYGFAGWRIGYSVAPEPLREAMVKAQDSNLICASRVTQVAALACLQTGPAYCRQHLPRLQRTREQLLAALAPLAPAIGMNAPAGAFYLMLRLDTDRDDMSVVEQLVRNAGVGVLPGSAFGLSGPCTLRVSYGALQDPTEAIRRLADGLVAIVDP